MIVKVDYQHFLSHLNLVQFVLDREIGTELRIRVRPIIVNILPAHITCCETGFSKYISRQLILRLRFLAYHLPESDEFENVDMTYLMIIFSVGLGPPSMSPSGFGLHRSLNIEA